MKFDKSTDSVGLSVKQLEGEEEQLQNATTTDTPVKMQETNLTKKTKQLVKEIDLVFWFVSQSCFDRKRLLMISL